ncbi:hypothetical protein [Sulfurimonas sp. HSL-1716]|uniref:hypothetical protein n=1 Tax=Hydrocurvibacter sulfurireducens TaxID=3131937 RepID=UPI0031F909D7
MIKDNKKFDTAVKNLAYDEENKHLGVLTQDGDFRIFNDDLSTMVWGLRTRIVQEHLLRQTEFISDDLKYIVLAKPKTNEASVLDVKKKKILYTISKNSGEIETLFINNTNKYLLSGGVDGRTYIFNLQTGHFLYNLPSHADYVTAITVTNTAQLVATGSFDGTIYLTNLNTLKNPVKLTGHRGYISGIEFLNNGKLVSADKNGNIIIFDFVQRKIKKRLQKVPDDITKIKVDANREFLFVGTKLGKVLVYDLTKEKLFANNFRKFNASISKIALTKDGYLYVGLQNGEIHKEKLIDEEKYETFYEKNDYLAIYDELERSPFVIYTQAYKKAERTWEEALFSAKELLSQQKTQEAKKMLEPFNDVPKKRTVIKTIIKEFAEFEKFKSYVEGNKYSLAYQMTLMNTSFLDTKEYKKMEGDWSKKFNKAQDIILDPRSDEIVKELLKDFRGIPSKTKQIQQLFKDKIAYNMLKKRLDAKNYKEIFGLIKQYPFLKESQEYEMLIKYADNCYINLMKAFSKSDFSKVKEYLEILDGFEDYDEELKSIQKEITALIQLTQACKSNDRVKMYEILDSLSHTVNLECVQKIKQEWQEIMNEADTLTYGGDVKKLIELFKDFFIIKSKSMIIKKYIFSAYVQELEQMMKDAGPQNEKIKALVKDKIVKVNDMFGSIEEIRSLLYSYNGFYGDTFEITDEKPEQDISKKEYIDFFG